MLTATPVRTRSAYPWYVVGVCTLAYVFSFIDRQILTLLIEPIRADLALNGWAPALLFAACEE